MTLCEAFQDSAARDPSAIALRAYGSGVTVTWGEYAGHVRTVAAGLRAVGVRHGEAVALMMANRPEFAIADTAALHLGAVPFSIDTTSSPSQVAYLLANSGARVAIVDGRHAARFVAAASEFSLEALVCVDGSPPGTVAMNGLPEGAMSAADFETAWRSVRPGDLATIAYTSGASGPPKGVEITHAAVLAQIEALCSVFDVHDDDVVLSGRSMAHITERLLGYYIPLAYAADVTCLADPEELAEALADVRPSFWLNGPRVFEKMRAQLQESARSLPRLRKWLWQLARTYPHGIADPLVLRDVRERIGLDRARFVLCEGAPLAVPVLEFFRDLGVPLYPAWGAAELAGLGTANPPGRVRPGTIGVPLPGVEARLSPTGELLVRGTVAPRGYRTNPAEAFDLDGWLRTGDAAAYDDQGYLRITGPEAAEAAFRAASPIIEDIVVVGGDRAYTVALVVLNPARTAGLDENEVDRRVEEAMAAGNEEVPRGGKVRSYAVVDGQWQPGDELTPTLRPRRAVIEARYAKTIEALYTG
jgi:long-chain acyl-CoA synthetase